MNPVHRREYLQVLGITPYVLRQPLANGHNESLSDNSLPGVADRSLLPNWEQLRCQVASCTACDLHETRTQTVFGVGDEQARLMIIGEAPGADEDREGEPFVGRAGQLLNLMLQAIGLERRQVFIANILKCRPPGNRNPNQHEAESCRPFLQQQIELLQPEVMLAVGAVAARHLLRTEEPVGRLRRRVHHYSDRQIPLLVTYHPAYLLRRPEEKAKVWDDLQRLHSLLSS